MEIEDVLTRKNDLKNYYSQMHRQMKKALDMYNGDWHVLSSNIRNAQKFHEVLPVTARLIVESAAANIRPSKHTVRFRPLRPTEKAKVQADGLEQLCNVLLERWGLMKALSPFAEVGKNVAIYGLSGLRTLYDPNAWEDRPVRKAGEDDDDFDYREALWDAQRTIKVPIVVSAIDPLNMLPPPGVVCDPPFMIEFYKVKAYMLQHDFPDYKPPDSKVEVDFTSYFDKKLWMYIAGNEKVGGKSLRKADEDGGYSNPYGLVPYTLVWGGLGKNSPYGKPEQRAVGLIYPLISLLEEEARSLTAVSIILQSSAIGRGWIAGATKEEIQIGMAPGDFTYLPQGAEIGWWPLPPVSSDLYRIMQVAGQQIERMVGEKILSGTRPTGVTSALFEQILLEEAKKRYKTLIDSMEAAYTNVLSQALFLYENVIEEQIPGTKIKPKEIRGYYLPEITFRYDEVAERRITAMIARMLFMSGLIDFETAHGTDYLNTEDVTGIRKGLIKDQFYKNPQLIAAMAMRIAEGMGLKELMENAEKRKQEEGQIIVPPSEVERQAESEILGPEQESLTPAGFSGGGLGLGEGESAEVR